MKHLRILSAPRKGFGRMAAVFVTLLMVLGGLGGLSLLASPAGSTPSAVPHPSSGLHADSGCVFPTQLGAFADTSSSTSVTQALTIGSGDTIVVGVLIYTSGGAPVPTISDTVNTYTNLSFNSHVFVFYYLYDVTNAMSGSVTLTVSAAGADEMDLLVSQFSTGTVVNSALLTQGASLNPGVTTASACSQANVFDWSLGGYTAGSGFEPAGWGNGVIKAGAVFADFGVWNQTNVSGGVIAINGQLENGVVTHYAYDAAALFAVGVAGTVPSVPYSLTAAPAPDNAHMGNANLTWNNPNGTLTDNAVYQFAGYGCTGGSSLSDLGGVYTMFEMVGYGYSTMLSFEVTASNSTGESAYSNCANVTTIAMPTNATAPFDLMATTVSTSEIDLTWMNPSGESLVNSTVIAWMNDTCGHPLVYHPPMVLYSGSVIDSFAHTGLTGATTFSYEVFTSNATGISPASSCATATTDRVLTSGWTTWTQPVDWQNYTLPFFAGTRYFFDGGYNIFDTPVVTNQIPSGAMTAFYVNASGQLLSKNLVSGAITTLHAWPTNLSNYNSVNMIQAYQGPNQQVTALYEMGAEMLPDNNPGYVWVAWYDLTNNSFRFDNTTLLSFDATEGCGNFNAGAYSATGWVFFTPCDLSTFNFFNVYSHVVVTKSGLSNITFWNSAAYIPPVAQVIEDIDNTTNNTLQVIAFNLTFPAGVPTIHYLQRWSVDNATCGVDIENMPYLFKVNGAVTSVWGLGSNGCGGNRNMVINLEANMNLDGIPVVTNTSGVGTSDESSVAFWDTSGYFFNGFSPSDNIPSQSPANQSAWVDPLNRSVVQAGAGSSGNPAWFNAFFYTQNFAFGGGPWVNEWTFVGPQSQWLSGIVYTPNDKNTSCTTTCDVMLYWVPSQIPTLTISNITGTSFNETWSNQTWFNMTDAFLIITNTSASCLNAASDAEVWTWYVVINGFSPASGMVDYAFNATTGYNVSFVDGETVWVGLFVQTTNFMGVFGCQQVTFYQPVPPVILPSINPILIIAIGASLGVGVLVAIQFRRYRKKEWV